ncbi:MAG: hypothetical protein WAK01_00825 [Methylocystis sp.]
MFNINLMKIVTILFAATACMAGYPCEAATHAQDPQVVGGK